MTYVIAHAALSKEALWLVAQNHLNHLKHLHTPLTHLRLRSVLILNESSVKEHLKLSLGKRRRLRRLSLWHRTYWLLLGVLLSSAFLQMPVQPCRPFFANTLFVFAKMPMLWSYIDQSIPLKKRVGMWV